MKDVPPGILAPSEADINGSAKISTDVPKQKQDLPPMYDPVGQAAEMERKDREGLKTVKIFEK